jgi:hypothetical protein
MDRVHEKIKAFVALPHKHCFSQYLDLQLLDLDISNPQSLISTKLTKEEVAAVRSERAFALARCINGGVSTLPQLYTLSARAEARSLPAFKENKASSAAGPFEGVKAADGHH